MRSGFQTHDGKIAGNRQQVESYDKAHGKKSMHMGDDEPKGKMEHEQDDEHMGGGMAEAKQAASEHGPAHKTETHHDHEAGTHHMVSHHPDGHMHRSSHESAAHAHAAAAHASGASDTNELSEAHGDGESAPMDQMGMENAGSQSEEEGGGGGDQSGFMD